MRTTSIGAVADRHAVDDPHRALGRVELGLEDERAVAVLPAGRRDRRPAGAISQRPLCSVAEERGEARAGVEPWDAEPVDRAVVGHERRGLGVSDQRVLLDA